MEIQGIRRDNWYLSEAGIGLVLGEMERCGSQFHEILREMMPIKHDGVKSGRDRTEMGLSCPYLMINSTWLCCDIFLRQIEVYQFDSVFLQLIDDHGISFSS